MLTLTMTRGLPGSGKSTWASVQPQANCVIVNKDDIRAELNKTGWTWSKEREKDVIAIRNDRIAKALEAGYNVISSDCNFGKHKLALKALADKYNAEFVVKDFTSVPLETCITRDSMRAEGKVGADVIKKMYNQYVALTEVEPYVPIPGKPSAIICDLDGTLALFKGLRGPYDYSKCAKDAVNPPVASIVRLFALNGYQIVYCSGREDSCRFQTEDFLSSNALPKGPLFMRATGDYRKDYIVKQELFDLNIRASFNVKFVLDDRDQVVQMWRRMGLTCLQVADGAF
jgi:predicted kinase